MNVGILNTFEIHTDSYWRFLKLRASCVCFLHACGLEHWASSSIILSLVLKQCLSLNRKRSILTRLGGQWALGICLSLPPNFGLTGVWPQLTFYIEAGNSDSDAYACRANSLTQWAISPTLFNSIFSKKKLSDFFLYLIILGALKPTNIRFQCTWTPTPKCVATLLNTGL